MQSAGLYLHIPFCEKKCGYCDFYSVTATNQIDRYLTAIKKEISLIAENYSDYSFNTVYFGGGTPTILSVKQIRTIWYELQKRLAIQHPAEITIEANPGTINFEMMLELKMLGFNRLSLGVQSFHATDLKILGRIHGINDILGSFEAARKAGFNNINLDLLNAFPGLTLKRFEASLNAAVQLEPEHISCYNLIYERGTPFYKKLESGLFQQLSETEEAEYLIRTIDILDNAGYSAYEISNYSKSPEFYCQHNLKYWNHDPYLGLGPSAHSFIIPERWSNVRDLAEYIHQLKQHILPVFDRESLSKETLEFEYIFLQLRLKRGIDLGEYQTRFNCNFFLKYKTIIDRLIRGKFLQKFDHRVLLTSQGWLLADEIASSF